MTDRAHRDNELIERYLAGDIDAFNELMAAHEDRVFSICLRMLRDREAALDATQDTFLTVFRKIDRFEARSAFSTWLYRVAMNTCYDHLRRQKRKQASSLPENYDVPDPTAEDPLIGVEVRSDIEDALAQLSDDFRAVVVLVDLEGMSLEQASDTLGIPKGTVKSRLFRARKRLVEILGNLRPPGDHPTGDTGAS